MKTKYIFVIIVLLLIVIINGCFKENRDAIILDGSLKWDMNDGIILKNSTIEVVKVQNTEFVGNDKRAQQILFLNPNLLPPGEEGIPEQPVTITLVNAVSIEDVSKNNVQCTILDYNLNKKNVLLVSRGHQISQLEATRLCVKINGDEFLEFMITNSFYELNWRYYQIKND